MLLISAASYTLDGLSDSYGYDMLLTDSLSTADSDAFLRTEQKYGRRLANSAKVIAFKTIYSFFCSAFCHQQAFITIS